MKVSESGQILMVRFCEYDTKYLCSIKPGNLWTSNNDHFQEKAYDRVNHISHIFVKISLSPLLPYNDK
jgi:hypothetical protein